MLKLARLSPPYSNIRVSAAPEPHSLFLITAASFFSSGLNLRVYVRLLIKSQCLNLQMYLPTYLYMYIYLPVHMPTTYLLTQPSNHPPTYLPAKLTGGNFHQIYQVLRWTIGSGNMMQLACLNPHSNIRVSAAPEPRSLFLITAASISSSGLNLRVCVRLC